MNCMHHYNLLIERARSRNLTCYAERHHVIPRCMGGGNGKDNLVRLTPEEHYIAHLLLAKMHPGEHKLVWAASRQARSLMRQTGRKNKVYGWLRRRLAEANKNRRFTRATREKMAAAKRGRKRGPISEEHRAKLSAASKGMKKSDEHRVALSKAKIGTKRPPRSEEWKQRQREGILRSTSNPSGFRGVYWCKQLRKWKARITVGGKSKYLGAYDSPAAGGAAYEKAARELFGSG